MDDEGLTTRIGHLTYKIAHKGVAFGGFFGFIDADTVLHSDRHFDWVFHSIQHGFDAICHQLRLGHQTRAKRALLHPLTGATTVDIDLVVTPFFGNFCGLRHFVGLTAAQLQGDGVFLSVKAQMARHITVHNCAGVDHFGVEQRVF